MTATIEQNKAIVRRFNKEIIEEGNPQSFQEIVDPAFINHTAAKGMDKGPAGLIHTFENILRPAFSDLKVTIYEQVGEGDKVTTRKTISGIHTGTFMGVAATHQPVIIHVMDMVTIKNGKYYEHWGVNTMMALAAELKAAHTDSK
ncbi:ester cyclase [Chitinophaga ginsengisoli]|uniref:SnoaL-like polyketide cyclase n=1 Tax=Chitinophaga ginsengisoli TaxID=363837 RepID=A0A2P8GKS2_9BACT|nr:ester cyclase [Chitinophaga ginsengisoli]PSL34545.1 SnoaL-like polyketide cyclase [Chitinophaga ginsengisoli]